MNNFWLSDNLTTQNWMADRADFLFTSLTSRLSDYYSSQASDQLQYGECLYAVAQELARLDTYANFMFEQGSVLTVDPGFFHITEAPQFNLPSNLPDPRWTDTYYRNFLVQLERLSTQPSTAANLQTLATNFFYTPDLATQAPVQVSELNLGSGFDNPNAIIDQHILNVRVPQGWPLDRTLSSFLTVVDQFKPAHIMVRFIATPMPQADYIHGATINDPFYFKYYVVETRPTVTLLSWAVLGFSETAYPTWFNPVWFTLFSGIMSNETDIQAAAQAQSGVFGPGVLPTSRYRASAYYFE